MRAAGSSRPRSTARCSLLGLRIDPAILADGDAAMLEDLVKAAVSAAQAKASAAAAEAMKELTGGLAMPGLEGMLDVTGV